MEEGGILRHASRNLCVLNNLAPFVLLQQFHYIGLINYIIGHQLSQPLVPFPSLEIRDEAKSSVPLIGWFLWQLTSMLNPQELEIFLIDTIQKEWLSMCLGDRVLAQHVPGSRISSPELFSKLKVHKKWLRIQLSDAVLAQQMKGPTAEITRVLRVVCFVARDMAQH